MYGVIIGDIVGSIYEVREAKNKKAGVITPYDEKIKILDFNTPLFTNDCSFTDDTVLSCAIYDAVIHNGDYAEYLRRYGKEELTRLHKVNMPSRFGKCFLEWLDGNFEGNSYGNGSAMRISAIGECFDTLKEVETQTVLATIPTHNNEDAINCAVAVSGAIFLAKNKKEKSEIKDFCESKLKQKLDFSLKELQETYVFTSRAIESVPEAIFCFLQSNSFEDCLRKSISIGGDSDTIAAIACSIAEQYYEIDENLIINAKKYLPKEFIELLEIKK